MLDFFATTSVVNRTVLSIARNLQLHFAARYRALMFGGGWAAAPLARHLEGNGVAVHLSILDFRWSRSRSSPTAAPPKSRHRDRSGQRRAAGLKVHGDLSGVPATPALLFIDPFAGDIVRSHDGERRHEQK